jgi:hypothetical protein
MAAKALLDCLEAPSWSKTTSDIVQSAAILDKLPDITQPDAVAGSKTQSEARKADPAWCDAEVLLELTEKQRETVKRCVTHWSEKGALPGGRYSAALLVAFGLGAE